MGVVFFPSLPFMGVMLFPSFRLGNAPGEGGASLALLSLFFIRLLPPLFFLSSSLFFLFLLLQFFISFLSFSFPSFSFPSFCLSPLSFASFSCPFFFFGETAYTVYFQDVGDDVTDRNPIVIRL